MRVTYPLKLTLLIQIFTKRILDKEVEENLQNFSILGMMKVGLSLCGE